MKIHVLFTRNCLFIAFLLLCFGQHVTAHNMTTSVVKSRPAALSALAFQIVSYDCNSGFLQYQLTGGDGSTIYLEIPGIFAGNVSANTIANTTYPADARIGRTSTGYAVQSGNRIEISFTTGCSLGATPTPTPTPNPTPTTGSLAFQIVSYDCTSGLLQYKMTGGDGSTIYLEIPGIFAGNVSANTIANTTYPADARIGRTSTGYAVQSGNRIEISFTTGCSLGATPTPTPTPSPTPTPTPVANAYYQGYLDVANCDGVSGWIVDQNHTQQSAYVDVYVNGQKAATLLANGDRGDVAQYFGISGYTKFGFNWTLPNSYKNGTALTISVKYVSSNSDVTASPKTTGGCTNPGARIAAGAVNGRSLFGGDPNLDPNWDWYPLTYQIWYLNGAGDIKSSTILNPFDNSAPGPIAQGDKRREDGWMLVARDFGVSPNEAQWLGEPKAAIVYPFFVLYNKYTGRLRVFIYNNPSASATYRGVTVSLAGGSNIKPNPALLAFGNPDSTQRFLDQYNPGFVQNVLANASPDSWAIADFDLSCYDPRLDTPDYKDWVLNITMNEITAGAIKLGGTIDLTGNIEAQSYAPWVDKGNVISKASSAVLDDKNGIFQIVNFFKGTAKIATAGSSILSLISAASDVINGFSSSSGSYDVSLSGKLEMTGTIQTPVKEISTPIYLKNHAITSPPTTGNYNVLQDIPWGIVGVNKFSGPLVTGYKYDGIDSRIEENGYSEFITSVRYEADGFNFQPIFRGIETPLLTNKNGLYPPEIQAAYFNRNGQQKPPLFPFTPTTLVLSKNFFNTHFTMGPTLKPFDKVGIYFNFTPVLPTVNMTEFPSIYKVFALTPKITIVPGNHYSSPISPNSTPGEQVTETVVPVPYPNPFSTSVTIPIYSEGDASNISVQIFSVDGKLIWETKSIFTNLEKISWTGTNMSNVPVNIGIYLVQIISNGQVIATHKVVLER